MKGIAMLLCCSLLFAACGKRPVSPDGLPDEAEQEIQNEDDFSYPAVKPSYEAVRNRPGAAGRGKKPPHTNALLAEVAKTTVGQPYVPGGNNPGGFDCSGLVQWTYGLFGVDLPRRASEQARMGFSVERDELQAGDIVTFRDRKRGWNHVGIYVGDGKFVHSPRKNKSIVIVSMDQEYFRRSYAGARRLPTDVDDSRLTELQQFISGYKTSFKKRDVLRKQQLLAGNTVKTSSGMVAGNNSPAEKKFSVAGGSAKKSVTARRSASRIKSAGTHGRPGEQKSATVSSAKKRPVASKEKSLSAVKKDSTARASGKKSVVENQSAAKKKPAGKAEQPKTQKSAAASSAKKSSGTAAGGKSSGVKTPSAATRKETAPARGSAHNTKEIRVEVHK